MILYCEDSLGCIDDNNIELINNVCYYALIYLKPSLYYWNNILHLAKLFIKFKITTFFMMLVVYSHLENNFMTTSFH